jgi:hypothetical protein
MNAIVKICWATVIAVVAITLSVPAHAEAKTKEVYTSDRFLKTG